MISAIRFFKRPRLSLQPHKAAAIPHTAGTRAKKLRRRMLLGWQPVRSTSSSHARSRSSSIRLPIHHTSGWNQKTSGLDKHLNGGDEIIAMPDVAELHARSLHRVGVGVRRSGRGYGWNYEHGAEDAEHTWLHGILAEDHVSMDRPSCAAVTGPDYGTDLAPTHVPRNTDRDKSAPGQPDGQQYLPGARSKQASARAGK